MHASATWMTSLLTLVFGSLWLEFRKLGLAMSFMVLGYVLERIDSIRSPKADGWHLFSDLSTNRVEWRKLLRKPHSTLSGASPKHMAEEQVNTIPKHHTAVQAS